MKFNFPASQQRIALLLIVFALYCNTLFNQYAQDDKAVVSENIVTKKGLRGIKDIFTHHYFYGNIDHNTGLYRPLPSLTHAIEWEFFKKNPTVSHFLNISFYFFTVLILYNLLSILLRKLPANTYISFIASLFFAIHPIHTEVVASIKGRDELLSLLFMLLAIFYFIKNISKISWKIYLISGSFFLLSLLSKESSILMIVYLSLIVYFFTENTFFKSIKYIVPFVFIGACYIVIRYLAIGNPQIQDASIFNLPYMYATPAQAFATKVYLVNKYLGLLFFPHPLLCDYTYNQIPYIHLYDIRFWISFFTSFFLLLFSFFYFKKKNIFAFCILFHFTSISIASNLIVKTSLLIADRTIYVGSIGFCVAIAYALYKLSEIKKPRLKKIIILAFYLLPGIVVILFSVKTILRNRDWQDDYHLFTRDAEYATDNVRLITTSAAFTYFFNPAFKDQKPDVQTRQESIQKFERAIRILPSPFPDPYAYLSYIYFQEDSLEKALSVLDRAKSAGVFTKKISDGYIEISKRYTIKGRENFERKNIDSAYIYFKKATESYEGNDEAWWNYGGICLEKGDIKTTVMAWEKVLTINPSYPKAKEILERVKADYKGKY